MTVDVLITSKNDVKLVESRTLHFASLKLSSRFGRINKLDCEYSYWQILSLVCPVQYHLTSRFYPIIPKARGKIAGVVNKVYSPFSHRLQCTLFPPKTFCLTIVSNFCWVLQSLQGKSKKMVMKIFFWGGGEGGGVDKVHYGLCENGEFLTCLRCAP